MINKNLNVEVIENEFKIEFVEKINGLCNGIYSYFKLNNIGFVTIEFCNSEKIKEINNIYRNKNSDTDVLSFEYYEKLFENYKDYEGQILNLGDILISTDYADAQSKELGNTFEEEVLFLICHAMLHLFGYDHLDSKDEKIMVDMQKKLIGDYHQRNS